MFEAWVAAILNRILGSYVQEGCFRPQNVSTSIYSGHLVLSELELKRDLLDFIGLPVKLVRGFIGKVEFQIPWRHLGSRPIRVSVDRVFLILESSLEYDPKEYRNKLTARKKANLSKAELNRAYYNENGVLGAVDESKKNPGTNLAGDIKLGFASRLIDKCIDNIEVVVRMVHIRYEELPKNFRRGFSVGVTLESLKMQSTDGNWKPCFVDLGKEIRRRVEKTSEKASNRYLEKLLAYKLFRLKHLAVYWNALPRTVDYVQLNYRTCTFAEMASIFGRMIPKEYDHDTYDTQRVSSHGKSNANPVNGTNSNSQDYAKKYQNVVYSSDPTRARKRRSRGSMGSSSSSLMYSPEVRSHRSRLDENRYILRPFCATLKLRANRDPRFPNNPDLTIDLDVVSVYLALERFQYINCLEMLSAFDLAEKSWVNARFRPVNVSVKGNPRIWWRFAIVCVLEEVKNRRERFKGAYITQRRRDRLEYMNFWKRNLVGRPNRDIQSASSTGSDNSDDSDKDSRFLSSQDTAYEEAVISSFTDLTTPTLGISSKALDFQSTSHSVSPGDNVRPVYTQLDRESKKRMECLEEKLNVKDILYFRSLAERELWMERMSSINTDATSSSLQLHKDNQPIPVDGMNIQSVGWRDAVLGWAGWAFGFESSGRVEADREQNDGWNRQGFFAMTKDEQDAFLSMLDDVPVSMLKTDVAKRRSPGRGPSRTTLIVRISVSSVEMSLSEIHDEKDLEIQPRLLCSAILEAFDLRHSKRSNGSSITSASLASALVFDHCSRDNRYSYVVSSKEVPSDGTDYYGVSSYPEWVAQPNSTIEPTVFYRASFNEEIKGVRTNTGEITRGKRPGRLMRRPEGDAVDDGIDWMDSLERFKSQCGDDHTESVQNSSAPVLWFHIDTCCPDNKADVSLELRMCSLQVIYSPQLLANVLRIFEAPKSMYSMKDIQLAAINLLSTTQQRTRAKQEYASVHHTALSLDIQIQAPLLVIPQIGNVASDIEPDKIILVDFGRMTVRDQAFSKVTERIAADKSVDLSSDEVSSSRVKQVGMGVTDVGISSHFRERLNSSVNSVDRSIAPAHFFDEYSVNCSDVQILISSSKSSSSSPHQHHQQTMQVVERFSFNTIVCRSIIPGDWTMPKIKLFSTLPTLAIHVSPMICQSLLKVLASLTSNSADQVSEQLFPNSDSDKVKVRRHSMDIGKRTLNPTRLLQPEKFDSAFYPGESFDSESPIQPSDTSSLRSFERESNRLTKTGAFSVASGRSNFNKQTQFVRLSKIRNQGIRSSEIQPVSDDASEENRGDSSRASLAASLADTLRLDSSIGGFNVEAIDDPDPDFFSAIGPSTSFAELNRKRFSSSASDFSFSTALPGEYVGDDDKTATKADGRGKERPNVSLFQASLKIESVLVCFSQRETLRSRSFAMIPKKSVWNLHGRNSRFDRFESREYRRASMDSQTDADTADQKGNDSNHLDGNVNEPTSNIVFKPFVHEWFGQVKELHKQADLMFSEQQYNSETSAAVNDSVLDEILEGENDSVKATYRPHGIMIACFNGVSISASVRTLDCAIETSLLGVEFRDIMGKDIQKLRYNDVFTTPKSFANEFPVFATSNINNTSLRPNGAIPPFWNRSFTDGDLDSREFVSMDFQMVSDESSMYSGFDLVGRIKAESFEFVLEQRVAPTILNAFTSLLVNLDVGECALNLESLQNFDVDSRRIRPHMSFFMENFTLTLTKADCFSESKDNACYDFVRSDSNKNGLDILKVIPFGCFSVNSVECRCVGLDEGGFAMTAQVGDVSLSEITFDHSQFRPDFSKRRVTQLKDARISSIPEQHALSGSAVRPVFSDVICMKRREGDHRPLLLLQFKSSTDSISNPVQEDVLLGIESLNSTPESEHAETLIDLDEILESYIQDSPPSSPHLNSCSKHAYQEEKMPKSRFFRSNRHWNDLNAKKDRKATPDNLLNAETSLFDEDNIPMPSIPVGIDLCLQLRSLLVRVRAKFLERLICLVKDSEVFGALDVCIHQLLGSRGKSKTGFEQVPQKNISGRRADSPSIQKHYLNTSATYDMFSVRLLDCSVEVSGFHEVSSCGIVHLDSATFSNRLFLDESPPTLSESGSLQCNTKSGLIMRIVELKEARVSNLSAHIVNEGRNENFQATSDIDLSLKTVRAIGEARLLEVSNPPTGERIWSFSKLSFEHNDDARSVGVSCDILKGKFTMSPLEVRLFQKHAVLIMDFSDQLLYLKKSGTYENLLFIASVLSASDDAEEPTDISICSCGSESRPNFIQPSQDRLDLIRTSGPMLSLEVEIAPISLELVKSRIENYSSERRSFRVSAKARLNRFNHSMKKMQLENGTSKPWHGFAKAELGLTRARFCDYRLGEDIIQELALELASARITDSRPVHLRDAVDVLVEGSSLDSNLQSPFSTIKMIREYTRPSAKAGFDFDTEDASQSYSIEVSVERVRTSILESLLKEIDVFAASITSALRKMQARNVVQSPAFDEEPCYRKRNLGMSLYHHFWGYPLGVFSAQNLNANKFTRSVGSMDTRDNLKPTQSLIEKPSSFKDELNAENAKDEACKVANRLETIDVSDFFIKIGDSSICESHKAVYPAVEFNLSECIRKSRSLGDLRTGSSAASEAFNFEDDYNVKSTTAAPHFCRKRLHTTVSVSFMLNNASVQIFEKPKQHDSRVLLFDCLITGATEMQRVLEATLCESVEAESRRFAQYEAPIILREWCSSPNWLFELDQCRSLYKHGPIRGETSIRTNDPFSRRLERCLVDQFSASIGYLATDKPMLNDLPVYKNNFNAKSRKIDVRVTYREALSLCDLIYRLTELFLSSKISELFEKKKMDDSNAYSNRIPNNAGRIVKQLKRADHDPSTPFFSSFIESSDSDRRSQYTETKKDQIAADELQIKPSISLSSGYDDVTSRSAKKTGGFENGHILCLTVEIEKLLVTVIDDFRDVHRPVVRIEPRELHFLLEDKNDSVVFCARQVFSLDYYNYTLMSWEPMVEPWKFSVSGKFCDNIDSIERPLFRLASTDVLNLNLSESFVETICGSSPRSNAELVSGKTEKDSESNNSPGVDNSALFVLRNETGMTFSWTIDGRSDSKPSVLESGQQATVDFRQKASKYGYLKSYSEDCAHLVSLWFKDEVSDGFAEASNSSTGQCGSRSYVQWRPVRGISFEREGTRLYSLKSVDDEIVENEAIVRDVVVVGLTTVMCIRSTLFVRNKWVGPVELIIPEPTEGTSTSSAFRAQLSPGESIPVPIRLVRSVTDCELLMYLRPFVFNSIFEPTALTLPEGSNCSFSSSLRTTIQFNTIENSTSESLDPMCTPSTQSSSLAELSSFCAIECVSGNDAIESARIDMVSEQESDGCGLRESEDLSIFRLIGLLSFRGECSDVVNGVDKLRKVGKGFVSPSETRLRILNLSAPVVLVNLLASPLSYRIFGRSSFSTCSADGQLHVGGSLHLPNVDPEAALYVSIKLPGFDWSSYVPLDIGPNKLASHEPLRAKGNYFNRQIEYLKESVGAVVSSWVKTGRSDLSSVRKIRPIGWTSVTSYTGKNKLRNCLAELKDSIGRSLSVQIEVEFLPDGTHRVVFYVPYWIVNSTDLHLLVRSASRSAALMETFGGQIVAGQSNALNAMRRLRTRRKLNERGALYRRGMVKIPAPGGLLDLLEQSSIADDKASKHKLMFSYSNEKRRIGRICMKTADSMWSNSIGLDISSGSGVAELKQQWTASNEGPRKVFVLGINVSAAEGPFNRTKVVNIVPRFVLVNALNRPLVIRQQVSRSFTGQINDVFGLKKAVSRCFGFLGFLPKSVLEGSGRSGPMAHPDEEVVALRPGDRIPFHWPDSAAPREVCVRFDEYGWAWSGSFGIDSVGELCVRLRSEHAHVVYLLRVEISAHRTNLSSSTLIITFLAELPNLPPYRIDNFSLHTLRLQQVGTAFSTHQILLPYQSYPYTWDEFLAPREVTIESLASKSSVSYTKHKEPAYQATSTAARFGHGMLSIFRTLWNVIWEQAIWTHEKIDDSNPVCLGNFELDRLGEPASCPDLPHLTVGVRADGPTRVLEIFDSRNKRKEESISGVSRKALLSTEDILRSFPAIWWHDCVSKELFCNGVCFARKENCCTNCRKDQNIKDDLGFGTRNQFGDTSGKFKASESIPTLSDSNEANLKGPVFDVQVMLKGIGMSCIESIPRCELIYVSIMDLCLDYRTIGDLSRFSGRLGWMQVDNQLYGVHFPVVLTPQISSGFAPCHDLFAIRKGNWTTAENVPIYSSIESELLVDGESNREQKTLESGDLHDLDTFCCESLGVNRFAEFTLLSSSKFPSLTFIKYLKVSVFPFAVMLEPILLGTLVGFVSRCASLVDNRNIYTSSNVNGLANHDQSRVFLPSRRFLQTQSLRDLNFDGRPGRLAYGRVYSDGNQPLEDSHRSSGSVTSRPEPDKSKPLLHPKIFPYKAIESVDSFRVETHSQTYRKLYIEELYVDAMDLKVSLTFRSDPHAIRLQQHELIESGRAGRIRSVFNNHATALNPLRYFFNTVGASLLHIKNAPVRLEGFELHNSLSTGENVVESISRHYQSQVLRRAYLVVASADILGDPRNLIQCLSTGLRDFFSFPLNFISRNPQHISEGVVRGTQSLFQNFVLGVAVSVTGLANGILALLDNISNDCYTGFRPSCISEGVIQGIAGLVRAPVVAFQDAGISGLGSGFIYGVLGMAIKPLCGLLCSVRHVFRAIQCAVDPTMKFRIHRVRPPRNFRCVFPKNTAELFTVYNKALCPFELYESIGVEALAMVDHGRHFNEGHLGHFVLDTPKRIEISFEDLKRKDVSLDRQKMSKSNYESLLQARFLFSYFSCCANRPNRLLPLWRKMLLIGTEMHLIYLDADVSEYQSAVWTVPSHAVESIHTAAHSLRERRAQSMDDETPSFYRGDVLKEPPALVLPYWIVTIKWLPEPRKEGSTSEAVVYCWTKREALACLSFCQSVVSNRKQNRKFDSAGHRK